jgi:hypothetical protein
MSGSGIETCHNGNALLFNLQTKSHYPMYREMKTEKKNGQETLSFKIKKKKRRKKFGL